MPSVFLNPVLPPITSHSFGYDCKKMANLHMIDDNTIIFAAGNVVQLLDLQTKEQRYIRSTSGGGIGAITVSYGWTSSFN